MSRVSSGLGLVLHPSITYLSPTNRRCRWVGAAADDAGREVQHFVYDSPEGKRIDGPMADGFALTAGNVRYMRRVN